MKLSRVSQVVCLVFALFFLLQTGCTPRVIVRAHPQPSDRGIRYYRPKPYLKVEPAEVAVDKTQTKLLPGMVRLSLVYLPDFSEEYAIDVRSGLGIANVGIKLQDGWNLTEISQELDSQTDENTKAVASLLSAVGDVLPTSAGSGTTPQVSFTMPARNVPLGFYESIIGRDNRGCKRLYGFRYVGFVPFSACPLDMSGQASGCCNDPLSQLYGLSFVEGQMAFIPLAELEQRPVSTTTSATTTAAAAASSGAGGAANATVGVPVLPVVGLSDSELEIQLRTYLLTLFEGIGEVRSESQAGEVGLQIQVAGGVNAQAIRRAADDWLSANYRELRLTDIDIVRE